MFYGIIPSNPVACWEGVRETRSHRKIVPNCSVFRKRNRSDTFSRWLSIAVNLSAFFSSGLALPSCDCAPATNSVVVRR